MEKRTKFQERYSRLPSDHRGLILLDRDGVINYNYPCSVQSLEEFVLYPGVCQAIRKLNQAQVAVAVVTNQAIVGRGQITLARLNTIHQYMETLLAQEDAYIDRIFYCTDTTVEPSNRRKPAPGMLLEALEFFQAGAEHTPMIGDDLRDLQAAKAAGCPRYLVKTGRGNETLEILKTQLYQELTPIHVFSDLAEAVDMYLDQAHKRVN